VQRIKVIGPKTKKSRLILAEGPDDKVVFAKELACRTKAAMQNSHRFFSKIFPENFPPKKNPGLRNPPSTPNPLHPPKKNQHGPGRHNPPESGYFTVSISEQRSIRALSGLTADVIRNDMGK